MRRLPAIAAVGITFLCLVNVSAQDEKDVGLAATMTRVWRNRVA